MPWETPTLREVRSLVRDHVRGTLPGADASVPNSVLRVLSDSQGALCHLTLQYLDWLALQLLPDTAETEWLDRHGDIWLVNSDGSRGRKLPTAAVGSVEFTGLGGMIVPQYTQLLTATGIGYETTNQITLDAAAPTPANVRALDSGSASNLAPGSTLALADPIENVDGSVVVVSLDGGADMESDEQLRARVLHRIQQPPQGGAAHDYVQWALAVPGVTRAWCSPNEMGMGTVTVRFMMDDLRADNDGFPLESDIAAVTAYLDTVRPVAVKDMFVLAPIPQPVDVFVQALITDNEAVRAAAEASVEDMLFKFATPGQTIYAAWKYHAIMETAGVHSFRLINTADDVMPSPGHMAVLGDISFQ